MTVDAQGGSRTPVGISASWDSSQETKDSSAVAWTSIAGQFSSFSNRSHPLILKFKALRIASLSIKLGVKILILSSKDKTHKIKYAREEVKVHDEMEKKG